MIELFALALFFCQCLTSTLATGMLMCSSDSCFTTLARIAGDLFDLRAEFELGNAEACGFIIRGVPVVYDLKKQEISCNKQVAPLKPINDRIRLRLLVDRGSFEIFGNDGRVVLSVGVIPADSNRSLEVFTRGDVTRVRSLEVFELKSGWTTP